MSRFTTKITILLLLTFTTTIDLSAQKTGIITPANEPNFDQQQMINRKYGMFIHFGINTFSGKEWTNGTLSPSLYSPKKLDTDQWAKTAKDAGMTYVILITKHHEGFWGLLQNSWFDRLSNALQSSSDSA